MTEAEPSESPPQPPRQPLEFRRNGVEWNKIPRNQRYGVYVDSAIRFARQLHYDVAKSRPAKWDSVVRHEKLDSDWERQMAGVRVALVHLVAQLDAELNRSFKALWERRPTLLHEELKKDPRFKDGIRLSLKDAWNPVVSPLPGGAHLQKRVLARLSEGGPKKKVESFLRLFKRTPPPEVTTRLLFDAIDVRNDYVHPSNEDQASGIIRASQPAWAPQPRTFPPP